MTIASLAAPAWGQSQTSTDRATTYELYDASLGEFRITYDVTATTPGNTCYWNSVRSGSAVSDVVCLDPRTGEELEHALVGGAEARAHGHADADLERTYIEVRLARPVPDVGGARIRIQKTYRDGASYRASDTGDSSIVFERSLSIERNRVVLPLDHVLESCNVPSQVFEDERGRVGIAFLNPGPGSADLELRAWRLGAPHARPAAADDAAARIGTPPPLSGPAGPRDDFSFPIRFEDTTSIVYELDPPETHAFRIAHDFTETRVGRDRYENVVRAGSTVRDPSAVDLDTGEALDVALLRDGEIDAAGIELSGGSEGREVVLVRYDPVPEGGSRRIRIEETYVDANRYGLVGDELVWNRRFGRPANAVVLPWGWALTGSAIPGVVTRTDDGRTRIDFTNPRPDRIVTLIRARRLPELPAAVRGRVRLRGSAPEARQWDLEPEMAEFSPETVFVDEAWLVDAEGGVANCVVEFYPGDARPLDAPEPLTAVFAKRGPRYEPRVLAVPVGSTVRLENQGSVCNGFMASGIRTAFNTTLSVGQSRDVDFRTRGALRVRCDLREYMRGVIYGVRTPYYAVTDEHGRFEVELPAGRWGLRVWHEELGAVGPIRSVLRAGPNEPEIWIGASEETER